MAEQTFQSASSLVGQAVQQLRQLPSDFKKFNDQGLPVDENGDVLENGQFTQKDYDLTKITDFDSINAQR